MKKIKLCFFSLFLMSLWAAYGEEKKVFIYSWANYIPKEIIKEFEKETGIKVFYDVFDSAEALETKLLMKSGYDVVFPPAWPVFARCVGLGIFQPLKKEWLPHAKGFDPKIIGKLASLDPQLRYGMPYLWGTTGIGYDKNAIVRCAPGAPLYSWALIFDPKVAQALAPGHIYLLDSATDVFQAALLYLGKSPVSTDPKEWDQAFALLMKVRPFISNFEGSKQIENLVNGQSKIIQGFSTYVNMARQQTLGSNKEIVYIIPKEGAMVWFDMMAIPVDAPHPHNAHVFIDFILRPSVIARITNTIKAANAIEASYPMIDKDLLLNLSIFPDQETLSRIHADFVPSPSLMRYISRQWLKLKMNYKEEKKR